MIFLNQCYTNEKDNPFNNRNGTSYAQNSRLSDYVDCIKSNSCNPVDYVFNLFEKSDIVVIGERDHRDTTQYELILDLLRDPRFAKDIGYVYTEVGSVNRTKDVNKLLCGKYESDNEFNDALYANFRGRKSKLLMNTENLTTLLLVHIETRRCISISQKCMQSRSLKAVGVRLWS